METLLNIDPVMSDQNLRGLKKLYNDVEANTRSLKALGVEPETYGTMLASVLLGKLPSDLRLIVSRKTSEVEFTLDALQRVLEEELTARERTAAPRERVANPNQTQPHHHSEQPPHPTTATLLSGTHAGPTCSYCQQSHASSECTTVTCSKGDSQIKWTLLQLPTPRPHRREMQVTESLPTLQEETSHQYLRSKGDSKFRHGDSNIPHCTHV